jgi:hypothetical protein
MDGKQSRAMALDTRIGGSGLSSSLYDVLKDCRACERRLIYIDRIQRLEGYTARVVTMV